MLRAFLALATALALTAPARAVEITAPRALLIDLDAGVTLIARDAAAPFRPGNFTKLMTADLVFEALEAGETTLDTTYPISEHAWRTGGAPAGVTTMFAEVNSDVSVRDLLDGLIVQNANDAAIVFAENLAGGEAAFAERMTARAGELGTTDTVFMDPTGLGESGQTTIFDLAALCLHIMAAHPDGFARYDLPEFAWNGIAQRNKNPLSQSVEGVDGFLLAYDETAGYGLALTAARNGRRVLLIESGLASEQARLSEATALLNWVFDGFQEVELFTGTEVVGTIDVYGGSVDAVDLIGNAPIVALLPNEGRDAITAAIVYDAPLAAPIEQGEVVAHLELTDGNGMVQSFPLHAAATVSHGTMTQRAGDALRHLLFFWR